VTGRFPSKGGEALLSISVPADALSDEALRQIIESIH
jgi:hypothetical protein